MYQPYIKPTGVKGGKKLIAEKLKRRTHRYLIVDSKMISHLT
jgi:hypothetical protein